MAGLSPTYPLNKRYRFVSMLVTSPTSFPGHAFYLIIFGARPSLTGPDVLPLIAAILPRVFPSLPVQIC